MSCVVCWRRRRPRLATSSILATVRRRTPLGRGRASHPIVTTTRPPLCPAVDARAPIINEKGEETVAALEFNITAVPALLYYAYGPKGVLPAHTIEPQIVGSLVQRGVKFFLK